jgi:hypothetical protein
MFSSGLGSGWELSEALGLSVSTVGPLVAEENEQDFDSPGRMDRLENDSVSAGDLSEKAFKFLTFEGFHQSAKGIDLKLVNVVKNSLSAIRRNRLKLFYGFGCEVYGPVHVAERPK